MHVRVLSQAVKTCRTDRDEEKDLGAALLYCRKLALRVAME